MSSSIRRQSPISHLRNSARSQASSINPYNDYSVTPLRELVNQFIISYVGEDKIISKVRKTDVIFHALRAVQELSYDTLKSFKSIELEVPNSLKLRLPQFYVNHTNIAWCDAAGILHTIYPANGKTGDPNDRDKNLITNSEFYYDASNTTLGTGYEWTNVVNDFNYGGGILATSVAVGEKIQIPLDVVMGKDYSFSMTVSNPNTSANTFVSGDLKATLYGKEGYKSIFEADPTNAPGTESPLDIGTFSASRVNANIQFNFSLTADDTSFITHTDGIVNTLVIEPFSTAFSGIIDKILLIDRDSDIPVTSHTFSKYKYSTPNENINKYDDGTYNLVVGERYGIEPQYAQANGTFFIDNGYIYFSSNLSGKKIVLKYISDGIDSSDPLSVSVHKFAEEAVYKHVAHAILSTRANTPEYLVARFKKEKFAATRAAKLRLSNLKLEELTQILRGKSKHIKH